MRVVTVLCSAALLSGCAFSSASLYKREPMASFTSTKAADIVSGCIATSLNGASQAVRVGEGHYAVTRSNSFGAPAVRYDVEQAGSGSAVQVRSASPVGEGLDKVRGCL